MTDLLRLELRLAEIAEEICPDYPDIKTCDTWEKLYAIEQSHRGFLAANRDLRILVSTLREKLQLTAMEVDTIHKEIASQPEPEPIRKWGSLKEPEKRTITRSNFLFSCRVFREMLDLAQGCGLLDQLKQETSYEQSMKILPAVDGFCVLQDEVPK